MRNAPPRLKGNTAMFTSLSSSKVNLAKFSLKTVLTAGFILSEVIVSAQPPVYYRPRPAPAPVRPGPDHRPAPQPIPVPASAPMPIPGAGRRPAPVPVPNPNAGVRFKPIHAAPPIRGNDDDTAAAELMAAAMGTLGCDKVGDVLRNLSNQLLANSQMINTPEHMWPPVYAGDRRGQLRLEMRRRWKARMSSPQFWSQVWTRLADAYRSCDQNCFDDGFSVGQISGALYCQASIELAGIPGVGYTTQAPLPMCENSIFVGCQRGYDNAVRVASGCTTYTQGEFAGIFGEYVSQDCHL